MDAHRYLIAGCVGVGGGRQPVCDQCLNPLKHIVELVFFAQNSQVLSGEACCCSGSDAVGGEQKTAGRFGFTVT